MAKRAGIRYHAPVLSPAQRRELFVWVGGAVLLAALIVAAAVFFGPDLDLLAQHYSVL